MIHRLGRGALIEVGDQRSLREPYSVLIDELPDRFCGWIGREVRGAPKRELTYERRGGELAERRARSAQCRIERGVARDRNAWVLGGHPVSEHQWCYFEAG